jgi:hypothetical protein
MLLSKLPVRKQDPPSKFLSLSPRRPNSAHPIDGSLSQAKTAYGDCICQLLRAEFCRKLAFSQSLANSPGLTAIKLTSLINNK